MKEFVEATVKKLSRTYCDSCGENCSKDIDHEYAELSATWGYCSNQDGTQYDIQICETCFTEVLNFIKNAHKQEYTNGYRNRIAHRTRHRRRNRLPAGKCRFEQEPKKLQDEANNQADLQIKEARLTAKRLTDEAEMKAEKILDQAENKNERIKQKKIQEAKEHFNKLKSTFDTHKSEQLVQLKEREMEIRALDNEFKTKEEKIEERQRALETQETAIHSQELFQKRKSWSHQLI